MKEYDALKQTVRALETQTEAANQAVKHESEQSKALKALNDGLHKELL